MRDVALAISHAISFPIYHPMFPSSCISFFFFSFCHAREGRRFRAL
jgi:hypothetical protein